MSVSFLMSITKETEPLLENHLYKSFLPLAFYQPLYQKYLLHLSPIYRTSNISFCDQKIMFFLHHMSITALLVLFLLSVKNFTFMPRLILSTLTKLCQIQLKDKLNNFLLSHKVSEVYVCHSGITPQTPIVTILRSNVFVLSFIKFCIKQAFIFKFWMIFGKVMGVYSQKIAKKKHQKYFFLVQFHM